MLLPTKTSRSTFFLSMSEKCVLLQRISERYVLRLAQSKYYPYLCIKIKIITIKYHFPMSETLIQNELSNLTALKESIASESCIGNNPFIRLGDGSSAPNWTITCLRILLSPLMEASESTHPVWNLKTFPRRRSMMEILLHIHGPKVYNWELMTSCPVSTPRLSERQ